MKPDITIRRMKAKDVSEVAEIEKNSFSQPWSPQAFLDAQRDSNAVFLVAEDETGKIIGYAGMYLSPPEGEITNVAVKKENRGQGCGQKLVSAMLLQAKEHGLERIVLEVRSSNASAVHVYQKEGFVRLGVRKNFYRFPREDADIMEWTDRSVKEEAEELC